MGYNVQEVVKKREEEGEGITDMFSGLGRRMKKYNEK